MIEACCYCGLAIGTVLIYQDGGQATLRKEVDHFFPKGKGGSNNEENLVASCHICNSIKRDRVFRSIMEVKQYVQKLLVTRGVIRYIEPWEDEGHEKVAKDYRVRILQERKTDEEGRQVLQRRVSRPSVSGQEAGYDCARSGLGHAFIREAKGQPAICDDCGKELDELQVLRSYHKEPTVQRKVL